MRWVLIGIAVAGCTPAIGEESYAAAACKAAASSFLMRDEVAVRALQDFSDLDPPRVRMDISPSPAVSVEVSCSFSAAETPLGLTEFCFMSRCLSEKNDPQRFQEVRVLLERAGY